MTTKDALLAVLDGSGQEHILADYDNLSTAEQLILAAQVTSFSAAQWKHMNAMLKDSLDHLNKSNGSASAAAAKDPSITPPPAATIFHLPKLLAEGSAEVATIRAAGMHVIARGEGAALLMAGGSGTRLGVTIPKGLFHCDLLPSGRSLFEYHCNRVRKMEQMAAAWARDSQVAVPPGAETTGRGLLHLLVMTSDQNDAATKAFFCEHNYFGLRPDQVLFFRQSSLPCYDEKTGKVLMEEKGKICVAPGGNGGLYESLVRTPTAAALASSKSEQGVLAQIQMRGVRYVQIFSVDNILAKLGDPYFFGVAAARQAEVVVKTVPKASAEERVGVFALTDGEWGVVEYTEIGTERALQRDDVSGELAYNCGNIASHCCSVDFLKLAAKDMQTSTFYHAARKNIATVNGIVPAIKMEAFIFDEFKLAKQVPTRPHGGGDRLDAFQIMQVDRNAEFAPIKNAEGAATDTATTAADLVLQLHTKWVAEAVMAAPEALGTGEEGYSVQDRATALQRLREGLCQWEINPLVSYEGEGLTPLAPQLIRRSLTGEGVLSLEETAQNRANM
ncbi:putative UDP-N-acetylglucosamine pyrophosphorylase [Leptomonas pyrrhocoris]|uniref:UDP-N-acetylglucosamine diphosphorylase n=1 Tax=Leptomonas pyrrhocoris TaxID=157538 RepID=A0A0N0DVZ1_LEPPY|nr:putative UDP-N-acetylglucosamine pyrophosphorylase [Leptomonas pyrrhocoris]KPA81048.1 putative UDP-N-acetylglucosamine pyrophosphorylase [Leptomonas pyrrhocoris]|eukprot:XP_015659487.1 putative UDP-N-acetylglucosamine pyrophosphorylase [Leptomonas pyrrhocoris]